ncbi:hypothetical protein CJ030_MR7G027909 [Morella rubra]|uniref:Uncharacterized protein n=1 Tax=Morella rubra TaxID=262757 RepID=A0A6A1V0R7_9ROSI|nr:hypothetical protein CJ030_MR7G027909 [Morella rubra]
MAPTVPIEFAGQKDSDFVPDYQHAVETMGESQGFGSSRRVETEMIVYRPRPLPVGRNGSRTKKSTFGYGAGGFEHVKLAAPSVHRPLPQI